MPPKKEIDDIIKRAVDAAVQAAMDSLSKDLMKYTDDSVAKVIISQNAISDENVELRAKVTSLEGIIKSLQSTVDEQANAISKFQDQITKALKWANKNEQYSRRNNVKIYGLKLKANEDTSDSVTAFLHDKLSLTVNANDIANAHILPYKSRAAQADEAATAGTESNLETKTNGEVSTVTKKRPVDSPPPIIVRFHSRNLRDAVVQRRKRLKKTGISIHDDMTTLNLQLINRLENHDSIQKSWAWNGKVHALTNNDKKLKFEPFDDINAKLASI